MIKRVNSTGRKRIPKNLVSIEVFDGEPRTFVAFLDMASMGFQNEAEVVIEATCAGSSLVKRFDFGTTNDICIPPDRKLSELTGENIIFGVKVIDRTERFGRILGICENVRPVSSGKQTASGRQGILPVEQVSLGDELWKLDFKEQDVFLLVNKDIPELRDQVQNPFFCTIVYPEIIRRVLDRAIEENVDVDDKDDDRWSVLWLRFGRNLHSTQMIPPSKDDSREVRDEWIDEVVIEFCREHSLKQRYQSTQVAE